MTSYLNNAKELAGQIKDLGKEYPDYLVIANVVNGLTPRYYLWKKQYYFRYKDAGASPTLSQIQGSLIAEENDLDERTEANILRRAAKAQSKKNREVR